MIYLNEKRQDIISVATEAFEKITGLSKSIRQDDKPRTGVQVLVRQPDTRNLIFVSIKKPSEAAQFFAAEKAVRSSLLSDMSSQNSEHAAAMQFAGSVTVNAADFDVEDFGFFQASVSGLKAEEDVTIAVLVLANLLGTTPYDICQKINSNFGKLPDCFNNKNYYLYQFVN